MIIWCLGKKNSKQQKHNKRIVNKCILNPHPSPYPYPHTMLHAHKQLKVLLPKYVKKKKGLQIKTWNNLYAHFLWCSVLFNIVVWLVIISVAFIHSNCREKHFFCVCTLFFGNAAQQICSQCLECLHLLCRFDSFTFLIPFKQRWCNKFILPEENPTWV